MVGMSTGDPQSRDANTTGQNLLERVGGVTLPTNGEVAPLLN
jgi:hypothetical protein